MTKCIKNNSHEHKNVPPWFIITQQQTVTENQIKILQKHTFHNVILFFLNKIIQLKILRAGPSFSPSTLVKSFCDNIRNVSPSISWNKTRRLFSCIDYFCIICLKCLGVIILNSFFTMTIPKATFTKYQATLFGNVNIRGKFAELFF